MIAQLLDDCSPSCRMLLSSIHYDDSGEQGIEKIIHHCFFLKKVTVRGVRPSIQHDISTAINTERSLCCLCGRSQEDACNFFSGSRHARYQGVVSYQLSTGQRNLYWFKESGKYCQHSYGMR